MLSRAMAISDASSSEMCHVICISHFHHWTQTHTQTLVLMAISFLSSFCRPFRSLIGNTPYVFLRNKTFGLWQWVCTFVFIQFWCVYCETELFQCALFGLFFCVGNDNLMHFLFNKEKKKRTNFVRKFHKHLPLLHGCEPACFHQIEVMA